MFRIGFISRYIDYNTLKPRERNILLLQLSMSMLLAVEQDEWEEKSLSSCTRD